MISERELAGLLYRADWTRQWFDYGAALDAVPPSARGTGFGGVGFLVDAMRDRAQEAAPGAIHEVRSVRMGGWEEYRIDVLRSARDASRFSPGRLGRRDRAQLATIASDGARQWQVFADRVVTGAAAPRPVI